MKSSLLPTLSALTAKALPALAAAVLWCAGAFVSPAQELQPDSLRAVSITATINASGHMAVEQPQALTDRLTTNAAASNQAVAEGEAEAADEQDSATSAPSTRAGYRIQVFDDNNPRSARGEAASVKSRIESAFPAWRAYVTFNSPYWRVKAGDFRSRAEAESAMAEIKKAFPNLKAYIRIVRDRINIYD